MHTNVCTCITMFVRKCIQTCIHTCVYTGVLNNSHAPNFATNKMGATVCLCTFIHTCIPIHTYLCTCIHAYAYIPTHALHWCSKKRERKFTCILVGKAHGSFIQWGRASEGVWNLGAWLKSGGVSTWTHPNRPKPTYSAGDCQKFEEMLCTVSLNYYSCT